MCGVKGMVGNVIRKSFVSLGFEQDSKNTEQSNQNREGNSIYGRQLQHLKLYTSLY